MKDRGYLPTTSMKRTITEQLLSNFQSNFLNEKNFGER